jgi:hypothetical protein
MTTLPLAVPLRGAAWLAVQPVTASGTVNHSDKHKRHFHRLFHHRKRIPVNF